MEGIYLVLVMWQERLGLANVRLLVFEVGICVYVLKAEGPEGTLLT